MGGRRTQVSGKTITADVVGGVIPDTIANLDLRINWTVLSSIEGKSETVAAPQSLNHLYVTGAGADDAFETVLDIGCGGAGNQGLIPGRDDAAIASAVFTKFTGKKLTDWAGAPLVYWGPWATAFDSSGVSGNWGLSPYTTAGLLNHHDGKCAAFSHLLVDVLAAQGVAGTLSGITLKYPIVAGGAGNLTADGFQIYKVLAGQNNLTPQREFTDHAVVKFGNTIFDPSYGAPYSGISLAASELQWEFASLENYVYKDGKLTVLLPRGLDGRWGRF